MDDRDVMDQAYRVAGRLVRERIRSERPDDARELDGVKAAEVAVISGIYDHIERVLVATGVPFTPTAPEQAAGLDWERLQVLLVSCPGVLPPAVCERIAPWVR